MMINIISRDGVPYNAQILDEGGNKMRSVSEVKIVLNATDIARAELTFLPVRVDIRAKAFVSYDHLKELAYDQGFNLVPMIDNVTISSMSADGSKALGS